MQQFEIFLNDNANSKTDSPGKSLSYVSDIFILSGARKEYSLFL